MDSVTSGLSKEQRIMTAIENFKQQNTNARKLMDCSSKQIAELLTYHLLDLSSHSNAKTLSFPENRTKIENYIIKCDLNGQTLCDMNRRSFAKALQQGVNIKGSAGVFVGLYNNIKEC